MRDVPKLDDARCEALARRALAGDTVAWRELVAHLWPTWRRLVGASPSMRRIPPSEDRIPDVLAKLVDKIGGEDGHGLRLYFPWKERNPDKTFADWIRILTANVVRDHVRDQLGSLPATDPCPSVNRLLNEFTLSPAVDEIGVRPPITAAQLARQLLEFARAHLSEDQNRALAAWIEGASFEEIDGELGQGPDAGRKLVRAAVAVLRRRFHPEGAVQEKDRPA